MSELSDYRRIVSDPLERKLREQLAAAHRDRLAAEALSTSYRKALEEIEKLAEECVVFDRENLEAISEGNTSTITIRHLWATRLTLSESWKARVDLIARQALSSKEARDE